RRLRPAAQDAQALRIAHEEGALAPGEVEAGVGGPVDQPVTEPEQVEDGAVEVELAGDVGPGQPQLARVPEQTADCVGRAHVDLQGSVRVTPPGAGPGPQADRWPRPQVPLEQSPDDSCRSVHLGPPPEIHGLAAPRVPSRGGAVNPLAYPAGLAEAVPHGPDGLDQPGVL